MKQAVTALVASITVIAASLAVATTATATHVDPTTVPRNPSCAPGLTKFKLEPVADGLFSDGTFDVIIEVRDTAGGQVFDWESNRGVDLVIAKGGPNGNIYTYFGEAVRDTGLHAPAVRSGRWAGLGHISFCYDLEGPFTPPS